MSFKFGGTLLAAALLNWTAPAHAQGKMPAISSRWEDMTFSQGECTDRARDAMRNNGFRRIELVGQTTFGDRGIYQIGIRCVADRKMYYIYGGGPEEPTVRRY